MEEVDAAVLHALRNVVTPDIVDDVLARLRASVEAAQLAPDDAQGRTARDIEAVEAEIARYVETLAMAGDVRAVAAKLRDAEDRRLALVEAQVARDAEASPAIDWCAIERAARATPREWRSLLARQAPEARTVLRLLFEDRKIAFTPVATGEREFEFAGDAGVGGLIAGAVASCSRGRWRPHRDSNPGFSLERAAS